MEVSDYMFAAVEAGVALAGFSAVVLVLRERQGSRLSETDRRVVASLVERGLVAAFLSLLPILLSGLGLPDHLVWFFSSGTFVAYGISLAIRSIDSRRRGLGASQLLSGPMFYALFVVGLLVLGLQLVHALGVGLNQSVWWYLVAVTWLLTSAGNLFFLFLRSWLRAA